jgi:tricorn protease
MGVLILGLAANAEEARLLRFPHVSKDKVAFSYGCDIYTAPREGGQASRLTSYEGIEVFPRFSPDGGKIAFTGQYDGDMAVYVIPITGGQPKKLSFHPGIQNTSERFGPENVVIGWNKKGDKVLFRSRKESMTWWDGQVYLVDTLGGLAEPLPMEVAGFTSFSPDESKVAYCPIYRDFRTWKRYKGGMAQDVWIYDLKNNKSEKITDWIGTDNLPMWYGSKIYFNSDRTGTLNLYCYDMNDKTTKQITKFTEYDVRWPSLGVDAIAFENGGFIYLLELTSETVRQVKVDLISDRHTIRPEFAKVADKTQEFDISPDGKRAIFAARGDIFTAPAKEGDTRNLTNLGDSRESAPVWSPDGKWITFISDSTGEDEIYLISNDGKEKLQLTTDGNCKKFNPEWSPDSKKLAFSDKNLNLYYYDMDSKKQIQIDKAKRNDIRRYSWSPDSKYLAYMKDLDNTISAIFIYSFMDKRVHQVTPGYTNDYYPIFDPDGKYLYFLSERNFNPVLSDYEFQYINTSITNLYLVLLSADEKSPFEPKNDEVEIKTDGEKSKGKESKKDEKKDEETPKAVEVKIDFDGIYDRQVAFDLPAGNYGGLTAISGNVFYMSYPISGLEGSIGKGENTLHKYDIKEKKDSEFAEDIANYTLSANKEKMIISKGKEYFIIGIAGKKAEFEDTRLDLSKMEMLVDHSAEYRQMYDEVWRMERDFFYDENLHGVDWNKMHDRYSCMLPYVAHRYDFTYLLGEMLGELCCSHTYIGEGEMPNITGSRIGLLGADFIYETATDRIKIVNILKGENWDNQLRSPLTEPTVNVKEGEYLLAIDGHELKENIDPYSMTANTVGKSIVLKVNDKPSLQGAREVTVRPIASEEMLRYYNWVEDKREYIDSVSNGTIGYIHIPDMGSFGLIRFMKMFYNQSRRDGLIIDVRYNGGGFVSGLIMDRLRNEVKSQWASRNREPEPDGLKAHMITLCNEFSCSDGDFFSYFFRENKLGPLMGKRTWGGVVGIGGFPSLLDGGYYTVPGGTIYNLKGEWVMENVGVQPDIEVENLPERRVQGYDDQLMQAIEYLQKKIKEEPRVLPPRPAPPTPR